MKLKQYLFGVPDSLFRDIMEHTQEAPVKGIGAAVALPGAAIYAKAAAVFQYQGVSLSDNVFGGVIDHYGTIVLEHDIYGIDKMLPVPVPEGFLKLRY